MTEKEALSSLQALWDRVQFLCMLDAVYGERLFEVQTEQTLALYRALARNLYGRGLIRPLGPDGYFTTCSETNTHDENHMCRF